MKTIVLSDDELKAVIFAVEGDIETIDGEKENDGFDAKELNIAKSALNKLKAAE